MTDRPYVLVIAGPNGSGKSTLAKYLMNSGIDFGTYINPDEIALTLDLPEPQRSAQAQSLADFQRDWCLQHGRSFSFETVMSHPSKVELMIRAHDAGYEVTLFFVATSDPEINVRRVENRVSTGGGTTCRKTAFGQDTGVRYLSQSRGARRRSDGCLRQQCDCRAFSIREFAKPKERLASGRGGRSQQQSI